MGEARTCLFLPSPETQRSFKFHPNVKRLYAYISIPTESHAIHRVRGNSCELLTSSAFRKRLLLTWGVYITANTRSKSRIGYVWELLCKMETEKTLCAGSPAVL